MAQEKFKTKFLSAVHKKKNTFYYHSQDLLLPYTYTGKHPNIHTYVQTDIPKQFEENKC